MAEPIYISKSSSGTSTNTGRSLRSQPIYESKRETEIDESHDSEHAARAVIDTSNENNETTDEKSLLEDIEETIKKKLSMEMLNDITRTTETDESTNIDESDEHQIPFADNDTQESERSKQTEEQQIKSPSSRPKFLDPYHISNIIKMHAPPPPPIRSPTTKKTFEQAESSSKQFESQTSMDTNCTSQTSLSIGLPNAQSTPFTSELTLKDANQLAKSNSHQLRAPVTTRGLFDEKGGILEDKTWNVTLIIPPNALAKQQEIYFTVSDPRMSKSVGGPPLDMENGWWIDPNSLLFVLCVVHCFM